MFSVLTRMVLEFVQLKCFAAGYPLKLQLCNIPLESCLETISSP